MQICSLSDVKTKSDENPVQPTLEINFSRRGVTAKLFMPMMRLSARKLVSNPQYFEGLQMPWFWATVHSCGFKLKKKAWH
jgi:hypothetical protein